MRIGLFGGTFDPIHLGHLMLAEQVRESVGLEKIIFIPSANPPHKRSREVSLASLRLRMVKQAIEGNPFFEVSDIELNHASPSYSVNTVQEFRKNYPKKSLFFIVGEDSLYEMHAWYKVEELSRLCKIVFANRPGFVIEGEKAEDLGLTDNVYKAITQYRVEMPEMGISSTQIRRRVAKGLSIRYWVPDKVEEFIGKKGLYKKTGV